MDQLARSNPFHVDDGDDVDDDFDDLQPDIATPTASTATGHHHQTIMTASYDEIEAAEEAEKRTMEDVSKMKEWVSLKLKELEDQNQHLKEENRKFNEELAKLKQSCLITTNTTTTSTATSTSNEKNSIKATPTKKNKKAFTPEVSRRRFPSSRTTPHDQHHYQNSFEIQQQQQQPSNFRQGFESASSQRRPQQRQRRRRYISVENVVDGRRSNSSNSSSTSSSSASSSASSDDDDEEEEFFVTKSRYARHLKAAAAAASASHHSRYQHQSPTRSRALRNAQAQAQAQPRIEGAHMTLLSGHSRQLIGSANCAANRTGSLDRKLTRMRRLNFTEMKRQQQQQQKYQQQQPPQHRPHRGETKQQQQQQQQQRKQQQMTTTELETTAAAAASPKTTKAVDHEVSISSKPPTPPLHRCPSWESRIYELANQGIRSAISTPVAAVKHFAVGTNTTTTTTTADSNGNHNHHHQQQHTSTNAFFGDGEGSSSHHLPLFKNINGRLAKIPNAFTTNHNHNHNNSNTSRMTASFDENCSMSSEADLLFEGGGGGGGGGTEQQSEALFTTSCLQQTLTATSNYLNHNSNTSSGNESDFRPLDLEVVDDAISLEEDSDDQDDYALPPDAMMVNGSNLLREEEERPKTPQRNASTRAPPPGTAFPVSETNNNNSIVKPSPVGKKCGYLLKLSGKGRFVRTWKRRWFVLKDGGHLFYYRSEEAYQKGEAPSAKTATPIFLEPSAVRLHRPETKESDLKSTLANTFQLHYSVTEEEGGGGSKKSSKKDEKKKKKRKKKVLTLSADSRQTLADWLRLLNQTLTANGISRLLQANEGAPPSIEGPLVRVRLGVSTRLWAALYGQHLVYYLSSSSSSSSADNNSSSSKTPIGYTALKGAKVQQIESFEGEEMGPPSSADHSEHATLRMKKDHLGLGNRTGTTPPPSLATPTLTISIHAVDNSCEPVYLRLATKQQCEQWACQLKHAASPSFTPVKRASPSAPLKKMTSFEEALGVLRSLEQAQVSAEEFYSSAAWNVPALCYSEEASLVEALTSAADCSQALKLFKALQLFISVPLVEVNLGGGGGGNATLNSPAIDYHVALAQNVLKMGLEGGAALQTELLLQLIKQSSPEGRLRRQVLLLQSSGAGSSVTTTSSSSNNASTSSPFHLRQLLSCASATAAGHSSSSEKSPPYSSGEFSSVYPDASGGLSPSDRRKYSAIFVQAFQLLALAISIFQPRGSALWLLRHHLRRCRQHQTDENLGSGSEVGQLAAYCERALARVLQRGGRRQIASRMEVLSILQRNPNKHSMPHSIPVHFANGAYQVVGFDGSSTVAEFVQLLNAESGIREGAQSGFALYGDDPLAEERAEEKGTTGALYLLNPQAKLADVIAHWECTLRKYHLGKFESTRAIKLVYRHRLCLRRAYKNETDRERLLWVWELNEEVVAGRFPVTVDLALQLATLLLQIELGDCPVAASTSTSTATPTSTLDAIYQRAVEQFLPRRFLLPKPEEEEDDDGGGGHGLPHLLREVLFRRWAELRGRSALDCVRIYLNCTRRWPLAGARLFPVRQKVASAFRYDDLASLQLCKLLGQHQDGLWLAVAEEATELLELGSMRPLLRIPHRALITFGGHRVGSGGGGGGGGQQQQQQQYFMLLVNGCLMEKFVEVGGAGGGGGDGEGNGGDLQPLKAVPFTEATKMPKTSSSAAQQPQRMLFSMSKRAIVEVTMLLADYISLATMSSTTTTN